jgi:hypothetical protein
MLNRINIVLFAVGIATEGRLSLLPEVRMLGGFAYVTVWRLLERLG